MKHARVYAAGMVCFVVFVTQSLFSGGTGQSIDARTSGIGGTDDNAAFKTLIDAAADDSVIDFHGITVALDNAVVGKPVHLKNAAIKQMHQDRPALTINGDSYREKEVVISDITTLSPTTPYTPKSTPRETGVIIVLSGDNTITLNNVKVPDAPKQGIYIKLSGANAVLIMSNCEVIGSGAYQRAKLSAPVDANTPVIPLAEIPSQFVVWTAENPVNPRIWFGDARYKIESIDYDKKTITFPSDTGVRKPENGVNQSKISGAPVAMSKDPYNGVYIEGSGKAFTVIGGNYSSNSHFGIFNRATAKTLYANVIANENNYIGLGNSDKPNGLIASNCTTDGNINNGIDINRGRDITVQYHTARYNGVDGIFIGWGVGAKIQDNTAMSNFRIGILLNGAGKGSTGLRGAVVAKNRCTDNAMAGLICTTVYDSTIQSNTFLRNPYGIKIDGTMNFSNSSGCVLTRNLYAGNSKRDIYINARNYIPGTPHGVFSILDEKFENGAKPNIETYMNDASVVKLGK
ncbi:MAG: right-handed parallel beta-helix repeat-containing protein [Spirochaetes bacterium]|nr:right-handed parallel beta-helix repeat-containing protein [Spirochaetota bacterium]